MTRRPSPDTTPVPTAPAPDVNPVPNPPPLAGDYLASRVMTSPGALWRSLLVWGWGQMATGDRRGWVGPPLQVAALLGLVLAAPLAAGTAAPSVFLAAVGVVAVWAGVGVHAWHRAARRRAALGGPPGGGAGHLLGLTPLVVIVGAVFWLLAGHGADPALALDRYLAAWRAGDVDAGMAAFARPPGTPTELGEAWQRQTSGLRNALVRIVAAVPEAEADPDRPLDRVRWVDLGATERGGRRFRLEVARQETEQGALFGILPTTGRRLVSLERLGEAELVAAPDPAAASPLGTPTVWRVVRVEITGETVGR